MIVSFRVISGAVQFAVLQNAVAIPLSNYCLTQSPDSTVLRNLHGTPNGLRIKETFRVQRRSSGLALLVDPSRS